MIRLLTRRHSNWLQIKAKKAEADIKKAQIRSKLTLSIKAAVKSNGPDPSTNALLRKLIEECKINEVPKKLIQEVIQRAASGPVGQNITLEAKYKSIFFLVDCISDNKTRTAQFIRKIVQDNGGQYCESGECSWQFNTCGVLEMYGRLSDKHILTVDKCVRELMPFHAMFRQAGENMKEREKIFEKLNDFVSNKKEFQEVIEPVPADAIFEKAVDLGAEDVYFIDLDVSNLEDVRERIPTPFYSIEGDVSLTKFLPCVRGTQILINTKHHELLEHDMRQCLVYGEKPLIHKSDLMRVPARSRYGDSVWQDMPSGEDRHNVQNILTKLHGHEEVVHVWHNIRGVEPWSQDAS